MIMHRILSITAVAFLFVANALAADEKYPLSAIPDSLKTGCDAVVRLDDVTVTVISDRETNVSNTYVVTVLNEKGASAARFHEMSDEYDKLSDFRAVVYDAAGKVVERGKKSDLIRSEFSGETTLADDNVNYYFTPTCKDYPYTVEYIYTIESKKLVPIYPGFHPVTQTETSTQDAYYRLITPKGFEVLTQEFNPQWKKDVRETPKGTEQCWQIHGMTGLKTERFMPDADTFVPSLYVEPKQFDFNGQKVSNESWAAYGQWMYSLMEGRGELPAELKTKVHALTDNVQSRKGKIEALYRYMCETCRYMNVSLGVGGLQPKTVTDTYRTKYGDCKALVFYLLSMLREVGIESNMCMISTGNERICPDFASHQGINHVILKVPGTDGEETLWLECTNSQLPFGYIHSKMDGHDVIVIADGNSHLETIPAQLPDYHYERNIASLTIAADGNIQGSYRIEQPDEKTETKDYKSHKACTQNSISIDANPFNEGFGKLRTARTYDISIPIAFSELDSIVYALPEGYKMDIAPAAVSESCQFGTFQASYTYNAEKHTVSIVQSLRMNRGTYPRSSATELKRFFDLINKHRKATVMVKAEK